MTSIEAPDALLRLHPSDDVAVARRAIAAGTTLQLGGQRLVSRSAIPPGHKVALRRVAPGSPVHKYGQVIGVSTELIEEGDHVHVHNLAMGDFGRDASIGSAAKGAPADVPDTVTFQGIRRPDGAAATRNYVGVLTSVNCSATVARKIAEHFRAPGALDGFPGVDGVVALTHGTGCGMAGAGEGFQLLQRTIGGYARHPNFAGLVVVGLGCEVNQVSSLVESFALAESTPLRAFTIQGSGGTAAAIRAGIGAAEEVLEVASHATREPVPVSELVLGLQCGGSDGYSGITANPALGAAADLLVRHGGTAVLGETPEIYGAEHLLTRRAATREVGERLLQRIRWWEDYTAANGGSMDNNPSPGNKAGGLTTILEKSLGAVAKGGTSDLADVVAYAEPVRSHGLVFMDTPGYDPVSVTGIVAGGANVVCFTTGRGSVFGAKPAPSLKLATNRETYLRMQDDMDVDCGAVLEGEVDVEGLGRQIFSLVVDVASGRRTKSEELGLGDEEMVPWQLGAVM